VAEVRSVRLVSEVFVFCVAGLCQVRVIM
jgi:hypothetical protein